MPEQKFELVINKIHTCTSQKKSKIKTSSKCLPQRRKGLWVKICERLFPLYNIKLWYKGVICIKEKSILLKFLRTYSYRVQQDIPSFLLVVEGKWRIWVRGCAVLLQAECSCSQCYDLNPFVPLTVLLHLGGVCSDWTVTVHWRLVAKNPQLSKIIYLESYSW